MSYYNSLLPQRTVEESKVHIPVARTMNALVHPRNRSDQCAQCPTMVKYGVRTGPVDESWTFARKPGQPHVFDRGSVLLKVTVSMHEVEVWTVRARPERSTHFILQVQIHTYEAAVHKKHVYLPNSR